MVQPLLESEIPGLVPCATGKVRDMYDLGNTMLIVASDRISAFDVVMPNGIPDKGRILTQISRFWFLHLRPFLRPLLLLLSMLLTLQPSLVLMPPQGYGTAFRKPILIIRGRAGVR